MELGSSENFKKPSRRARFDADVLNRTKSMHEDPSLPALAYSHGYVLSRSRTLALLLTSLVTATYALVAFFAIDHLGLNSHNSYFHVLGINISRSACGRALLVTCVITIDYALLLRGVEANRRWLIAFLSVMFAAIVVTSIFGWIS